MKAQKWLTQADNVGKNIAQQSSSLAFALWDKQAEYFIAQCNQFLLFELSICYPDRLAVNGL